MATVGLEGIRARKLGASASGETGSAASSVPANVGTGPHDDAQTGAGPNDDDNCDELWDEGEDASLRLIHRGPVMQSVFGPRKITRGERVACGLAIIVLTFASIAAVVGLANPAFVTKLDNVFREEVMSGNLEAVTQRLDADEQEPHAPHRGVVHAEGKQQLTALHWAAIRGQPAVADLLLQRRAEVAKKSSSGMTPLHYSAREGHVPVADVLVEYEAPLNEVDNNGWTPLHWAALYGHAAIAKSLIGHRADARIQNSETFHRTALDLAEANRHTTLIPLLREAATLANEQNAVKQTSSDGA